MEHPGASRAVALSVLVDGVPYYRGLTAIQPSTDLCISVSAGVAVQAILYYAQF